MKLTQTRALMQRKLEKTAFDTYGVLIGCKGEEEAFFSENANEDTLFDIASCGKVLHTVPLALQAIGEGKLSLDSVLDDFFPNVPEEKKRITVRQLMTHTSGIVRIPLLKEICAQGTDATAALILSAPLAFAPGSNYVYSCNGMNLLGFIVEKLYGKTMDRLFEERLKAPLGMTRSRFEIAVDEPNAAVCYTRAEAGATRFDDDNVQSMGRVCGAGGSFFTGADIRKYVHAVLAKDERLYRREFFALAETDYTPHYEEGRGLGWLIVDGRYPQTGTLFPAGSFGHCGHTGQSIYISRELGLYVILLSNATRFSAMKCNYQSHNYDTVEALRAEIHNTIHADLRAQGLVK